MADLSDLCDGPETGPQIPDHRPEPTLGDPFHCVCGSAFRRCGCPIGEPHDHLEDDDDERDPYGEPDPEPDWDFAPDPWEADRAADRYEAAIWSRYP